MNVEYINPFVTATISVFDTMLACPLSRGAIRLSTRGRPEYDLSGLVTLSGSATGLVVFSVDKQVAFRAAHAMLGDEIHSINEDVVDMTGELTNMIAGAAKAKLEELALSIGLPKVLVGTNHVVDFPAGVQPISIPFDSDWGPLCLEVSLSETQQASAADAGRRLGDMATPAADGGNRQTLIDACVANGHADGPGPAARQPLVAH